ncbi:MAG: type II toxin-antitoxin system RelE/ParE family toxin [Alphaproteobacteria bacterium]
MSTWPESRAAPGGPARFRVARRAQTDLMIILGDGAEKWGAEASRRYGLTLMRAMRQVASDPEGRLTRPRPDIRPDLRSFHLRHVRQNGRQPAVKRPVHVIYYRLVEPGLIEIARILHDRMEPARQFETGADELH